MTNPTQIAGLADELRKLVPEEQHEQIAMLVHLLSNAGVRDSLSGESVDLQQLITSLAGKEVSNRHAAITFGPGSQTGDVSIRDIVSGNIYNFTIQFPSVPQREPLRPSNCSVVSDFVGREQEKERITAFFRSNGTANSVSVLIIRGLGGLGKTVLSNAAAVELTHHFPDGQFLLALQSHIPIPPGPAKLLEDWLHLISTQSTTTGTVQELQQRIRSALQRRRVLIIADDARDEIQLRPLLEAIPVGCGLIVTTRHRFALPGAKVLDLEVLDQTSSRALIERLCPRIGLYADQLASLCAYLPLALRVSASLLSNDDTIPVPAYIKDLSENKMQQLFNPEHPDEPTQSVEASLRTSFEALSIEAQQLLCQLSIFSVSFDRDAVVQVATVPQPERLLGLLRRRSLVEPSELPERFQLHDLVRAFGEARLEDVGTIRKRYIRYFLQVVAKAETLYLQGGPSMKEGVALFDRERQHIDTAWKWTEAQAGNVEADALLVEFANATAYLGHLRYDPARERIPRLEAVVAAARRLQDRRGEGDAIGHLGNAYRALGNPEQAIKCFEERLAIVRELGDRQGEGSVLGNLRNAYRNQRDAKRAKEFLEQALTIRRESGDRHSVANTLGSLASVYLDVGEFQQSIALNEERLTLVREIADFRGEAGVLGNLAQAYSRLHDYERAEQFLQQALVLTRQIGDQRGEHAWLRALGEIATATGAVIDAIGYYKEAVRVGIATGNLRGAANTALSLSHLYEQQGDFIRAKEAQQQHIDCLNELGSNEIVQAKQRLAELQERIPSE